MVISVKDGIKIFGIIIVSFCAVFVCTLFLNYYVDALAVKDVPEIAQTLYDAQVAMARFVCMITGGCLCLTAAVMLVFYIKLFIDGNVKRFGLLKAMGYSDKRIALSFWVFGLAVLIGAAAGCACGYIAMPFIYKEMSIDGLNEIIPSFNAWLPFALVIAPAAVFSALSILYAKLSLRQSAAVMLKGGAKPQSRKLRVSEKDRTFISDMRRGVLRTRKSAVFFIAFSCFCFSAMLQMGLSMRDLSSVTMGGMIAGIGVVLSVTALIMAVTTVVNGNARNIAVMKAFGYTGVERASAVLLGYVPFAVLGFAVGTVYQYVLLKLMVDIMFKDVAFVPEYSFDVPAFFIVLAMFAAAYFCAMYYYSRRMEKISVKLASSAD